MTIKISKAFLELLKEQVHYIYKDKPKAALKFRKDLLNNIKKDLKHPFQIKKSIFFDNEYIRDYIFKGYVSVYEINLEENIVVVFGFIKYRDSL